MSKTVLIAIAQGTEEIEAITVADLLRRAGIYVRIAGENEIVTCSRGIKIIPDMLIDDLSSDMEFAAVVLPGGQTGTLNLLNNDKIKRLLTKQQERGGIIAAICAAPSILFAHKLLPDNCRITSHPSIRDTFAGFDYVDDDVVFDRQILTSRGVGTTIAFSLKIIELIAGKEAADKIAGEIVYEPKA